MKKKIILVGLILVFLVTSGVGIILYKNYLKNQASQDEENEPILKQLSVIPVLKAGEVYLLDPKVSSSISSKPIGKGDAVLGEINGKILIAKGGIAIWPPYEGITQYPFGRTLYLQDPETKEEKEIIKDPIVIKAVPSHKQDKLAILTYDVRLAIFDFKTNRLEIVVKDLSLPFSNDEMGNPLVSWSLDDSYIWFSAWQVGWEGEWTGGYDLYTYDLKTKKTTLIAGGKLVGENQYYTYDNDTKIDTGINHQVLGTLKTDEVLIYYNQSGRVLKDGSIRNEWEGLKAIAKDRKERVILQFFPFEGLKEPSLASSLDFKNDKLLALKDIIIFGPNGEQIYEAETNSLYIVEFKNGEIGEPKLLVKGIKPGLMAKFLPGGFIAYKNPYGRPDNPRIGYWTILNPDGTKFVDLQEGEMP